MAKIHYLNNPENPSELALFLYETYYPLSNELVYTLRRKKQTKPIIIIMGMIQKGISNE